MYHNDIHLKGCMSEIKVQLHFLEMGWDVFQPVNPKTKADLIITHPKSGRVKKVQVKTIQDNTVGGITYRQCRLEPNGEAYKEHEIDLFVFVYPPTGEMWSCNFIDLKGQKSVNVGRADGQGRPPKNVNILNKMR